MPWPMRQAPGLPRVDVRINGVEIESVDGTSFGGAPHVLVGSDRGSNVDVYLVTDRPRPATVGATAAQSSDHADRSQRSAAEG